MGGLSWGYLYGAISHECTTTITTTTTTTTTTTGGSGSLQSSREDLCEAGLDDGGVELRSVRTGLGEEVFASQLYSQVAKAGSNKALAAAKVRMNLVRFFYSLWKWVTEPWTEHCMKSEHHQQKAQI